MKLPTSPLLPVNHCRSSQPGLARSQLKGVFHLEAAVRGGVWAAGELGGQQAHLVAPSQAIPLGRRRGGVGAATCLLEEARPRWRETVAHPPARLEATVTAHRNSANSGILEHNCYNTSCQTKCIFLFWGICNIL